MAALLHDGFGIVLTGETFAVVPRNQDTPADAAALQPAFFKQVVNCSKAEREKCCSLLATKEDGIERHGDTPSIDLVSPSASSSVAPRRVHPVGAV